MIVSGFTSFSENFVIRCNQITKIFCSKYCITCAFPAKSPCNLGSLAYFAISVLREVQEWETTQNVFKCAVHNGQCEVFSRDPTWAQDVWVWEEYQCRVFCYRLWCDQLCNNITRVQLARLLASRGCVRFARRPLVALGKFHKSYACSHESGVQLVQFTIRSACNSSLSLVSVVPAARRTRLAQLCLHTKHWSRSVESLTSQRFRPDVARVHISLDWWHRQQFQEYQILNE